MSSPRIEELAREVERILRAWGRLVEVDRDRLADAIQFAELFYASVRHPFDENAPGVFDFPALNAAADRLIGLLWPWGSETSAPRDLVKAIAAIETEEFGPPVSRAGSETQWQAREETIYRRIAEMLPVLLAMCDASRAAPEPERGTPGPARGRREIEAAVSHLAEYWVDVLGQKFTVTFARDKPASAEPRRARDERGRHAPVHEGAYVPTSAAAEFVVAAMEVIDPGRRPEDVEKVMQEVRKKLRS